MGWKTARCLRAVCARRRCSADRLSGLPFDAVWHSPLVRATESGTASSRTACRRSTRSPNALLFDCVPTGMTEDTPTVFEPFFGSFSDDDFEAGKAQMADAINEFLVRKPGDVHELLITHNFVISWFVREIMGADEWRWLTLNQAHCGLTVLAQKKGRPWSLVSHNDIAHLPYELRTGLPEVPPV